MSSSFVLVSKSDKKTKKKGDEERRSQNRAEHQWIGEIPGQSL